MNMLVRTALLAIATVSCSTIAVAQRPATQLTPEIVEAYADGMVRAGMDSNNVAGVSVAVVKDGKILVAKAYGTSRITPAIQKADAQTLFQLASLSKTLVYIAVMQLVEQGRLKLDDPVNAHLPTNLKIPDQGFQNPIRIRHLITHTAGFEDSALGHLFVDSPEKILPIDQYLTRFRVARVREPGRQISYSNYALVVLGRIIELKSRLDFPSYMEARVLRPLGMSRSTFREPYPMVLAQQRGLPAPMSADLAANITQQLAGLPNAWTEKGPEWTTMTSPAAGLRASSQDMARFTVALVDPRQLEEKGVLKASSFARLLEPGIGLPSTAHHGFMHYSLGGGRSGFGHGGAMAFGASDLIIVPELNLGAFVSTNGRGGFSFAHDLIRRLIKDLFPIAETVPVRTESTIAAAKALEGHWTINRRPYSRTETAIHFFRSGFTVRASSDGDIVFHSFFRAGQRFQPVGNNIWESPINHSRRIAGKDPDGKMTIWHGSGTGGSTRAGILDRPFFVLAIFVVTLGVAILTLGVTLIQLVRSRHASRTEKYGMAYFAGAALAWVIGLGGLLITLFKASLDEGAQLLFDYPGPMIVYAWAIAIAALMTAIAVPGYALARRRLHWKFWQELSFGMVLTLFAVTSFFCWRIGLVGFSGF